MKEADVRYKDAKAKSDALHDEYNSLKMAVIDVMEKEGKTSYTVDGVAKVTLSYDMSVQTPKTLDEKRAFFAWLEKNLGKEAAESYMTVNSITLNSLYNTLNSSYAERGEILEIDGLQPPTSRAKLSVRKA
jgi:hypothetical protein